MWQFANALMRDSPLLNKKANSMNALPPNLRLPLKPPMQPATQQPAPQPAANLIWSTIGEQSVSSGLKSLVYGGAGIGKTVLCATLPAPIIFINAESGALSLREPNLFRIFTEHLGMNPDLASDRAKAVATSASVIVRNGAELRKTYEELVKYQSQYASIGWDGISETAEAVLSACMAATTNGQRAYGEMADLINEFVRKFKGLNGKHMCLTAKMALIKDEQSGVIKWSPDLPGKVLPKDAPYWFDETFFMNIWEDSEGKHAPVRYLQTQPDQRYTAKDRSGVLDQMERPDLTYIINKIMNA